jgi:hypothetical protein
MSIRSSFPVLSFTPSCLLYFYALLMTLFTSLASPSDSHCIVQDQKSIKLTDREHETNFADKHFADDFISECEIYNVNTKKRVALLPEATRWFDEDGDIIETRTESESVIGEEVVDEGNGVGGGDDEKEDDE